MRKASELGFDDKTGHVTSYQSREIMDEDIEMEKIEKAEGIKDEDFKTIKEQIATLRRTLGEISRKQVNERHRLVIHSATNEHSHSRMVLGSLLETVLFMVVTGFQVYTIRKWFQGAPVLGR
jgi:reverse gyrase